jgi:serine/threonine protein kinase
MAACRLPPPQAGTLSYQAPEIFGDGDEEDGDDGVGVSSFPVDVFAFGVILWELGTREVPWGDALPGKVRGAGGVRRSEHPPPPSD